MKVTEKQIKDAIDDVVFYSFDSEYIHLLEDTINRIDNYRDEENIDQAIEIAYTYNYDVWTIAKHFYRNPLEINPDDLQEFFAEDVYNICHKLAEV